MEYKAVSVIQKPSNTNQQLYDHHQTSGNEQIIIPVSYTDHIAIVDDNLNDSNSMKENAQIMSYEAVKLNDGSTVYRTTYQSATPMYETQLQIDDTDRQPPGFPIDIDIVREHQLSNRNQAPQMITGPIETENYTIRVEPSQFDSAKWDKIDTYIHIFLTFFFGHFASMLLFDGILRNISNVFQYSSIAVYVIHILFSIAYLAFTIWFLTICWRWWRNKSLIPENTRFYNNQTLNQQQQKSIAYSYALIAALFLAIGLIIYIILIIIEFSMKRHLTEGSYFIEIVIFLIRIGVWIVAIGALLCLSRERISKYICPQKLSKTTIYERKSSQY